MLPSRYITLQGGHARRGHDESKAVRSPFRDGTGDHHVLRAATVGAGHVVVWGDEWISFDTVWQDFPQTLSFWQNIIDWFDPQAGCVVPPPN